MMHVYLLVGKGLQRQSAQTGIAEPALIPVCFSGLHDLEQPDVALADEW